MLRSNNDVLASNIMQHQLVFLDLIVDLFLSAYIHLWSNDKWYNYSIAETSSEQHKYGLVDLVYLKKKGGDFKRRASKIYILTAAG